MKRFIIVLLFIYAALNYKCFGGNIPNIYSDQRALHVDDILTILINESAQAGSQSATNTDKEHSYNVSGQGGSGLLSLLPKFGATAGTSAKYDGAGSTTREGSLVATISARVIKVLDNGNLVIEGNKTIEVNDEKGIIKISGIVRPMDIQQNNLVYSSNIADAQIMYSGKGIATNGQRPGVLARFFNWIF